MIRLDSTLRKIEVVLAAAVATTQPAFTAGWSDATSSDYVGGTSFGVTNSSTPVILVAAPAASVVRDIDNISLVNRDSAPITVTINLVDNVTSYPLFKCSLAAGDNLSYTHSNGWQVVDASGNIKLLGSLVAQLRAQLGLSATPANNFTFDASANNGTMKLARGNAGATTQDLLTVSAANLITGASGATLIGNGGHFVADIAASGSANGVVNFGGILTNMSLSSGTWTANKLTPNIPGYYQCNITIQMQAGTSISYCSVAVRKNGSSVMQGIAGAYATLYSKPNASGLIYMNGTTDYFEFFHDVSFVGAVSIIGGSVSAYLVRSA